MVEGVGSALFSPWIWAMIGEQATLTLKCVFLPTLYKGKRTVYRMG